MAERKTINEIYNSFPSNQTGEITAQRLRNFVKSSFAEVADRAPTSDDDSDSGFNEGDLWLDLANNTIWVCFDNTSSLADWRGILTTDTGDFNLSAISIEEGLIKGTTSSGITISDNPETSYATFDEGITLESPYGVKVIGDFYQSSGVSFVTESEKVRVYDNLAILNKDEVGAGVTEGFSGWEVDRGYEYVKDNATPFRWGFDEGKDRFVVGKYYTELEIDTVDNFILNEKVTGQSSSAVGYVYSSGSTDSWNYIRLKDVNGSFEEEQIIADESGSSGVVVSSGIAYYDNTQTIATVSSGLTNNGIMYWNEGENYIENSSGLTFTSGVTISNQLVVGSDSDVSLSNDAYSMFIEGDTRINTEATLVSKDFTSGWNNKGGFRLTSSGASQSNMVIDDLTVRSRMDVFEILVNQIRGTNGNKFITSSAKCKEAGENYITFEDPENDGLCPFLQSDLILSQTFEGTNYTTVRATVTDVSGTTVSVNWDVPTDTSTFDFTRLEGSAFVRVGSSGNTERQDSIYIAADDDNTPFMDFMDGVDSWSAWDSTGTTKVRLGRLDGIYDSILGQLNDYGLYGNRLYISSFDDNNYITLKSDENNSVMDMAYGGNTVFKFDSSAQSATLSDWNLEHDSFYSLGSGTPSSSPSSGVVLDASFYGIKGYDPSGNSVFKLGKKNEISGLEFDNSRMFKENEFGYKYLEVGDIASFSKNTSELTVTNDDFSSGSTGWSDNSSLSYISSTYGDVDSADSDSEVKGGFNSSTTGETFTDLDSSGYTDPAAQSYDSFSLTSSGTPLPSDCDSRTSFVYYFNYVISPDNTYTPFGTYPSNVSSSFPDSFTDELSLTIKVLVNGSVYKSKTIDNPFYSDYPSDYKKEYISFTYPSNYTDPEVKLKIESNLLYWYLEMSNKTGYYDVFDGTDLYVDDVSLTRGYYRNQYSQEGINLYRSPEKYFEATPDKVSFNTDSIDSSNLNIDNTIKSGSIIVGKNNKNFANSVAEFGSGDVLLNTGSDIRTDDFNPSLYNGNGFGAIYSDSSYQLYTDDLHVRGRLEVSEIIKNKVSTVGGDFLVSGSYKCDHINYNDSGPDTFIFAAEEGRSRSNIDFNSGDIVVVKEWDSTYGGEITNVDETLTYMRREAIGITISWESGYTPSDTSELLNSTFSRIGSAIDSARDNIIYMSSDDSAAPLISLNDNVKSVSDWYDNSNKKVHIGKLDGISDSILGSLSGYGMYADSIYLSNDDSNNGIVLETDTPLFEIISNGSSVFKFDGSTPFISGWDIGSNELSSSNSSGRTIGLISDSEPRLFVKNENDNEIISVGDTPFPSASTAINIPDGDFEDTINNMSWSINEHPDHDTESTSGRTNNGLKVYAIDSIDVSDGVDINSSTIYQNIDVSGESIVSDHTMNLSFYVYGDERYESFSAYDDQTLDLKVEVSYDGGSSYNTAVNDSGIPMGFTSWKKIQKSFSISSNNPDYLKISVTFNIRQYHPDVTYYSDHRGMCIIDDMSFSTTIRDVTLNSNGLRIFSNPDEYVELTKDGINAFAGSLGAKELEIHDTLEVFGNLIVHGSSVTSETTVQDGDIIPSEDNTYKLGDSGARWSELYAVDADIGGLYESELETDGINALPKGTVLIWEDGGLKKCYKSRDSRVIGVSKNKDRPIVHGAEPVRVIGSVSSGDYLVTSNKEGCARSLKWYEKILYNSGKIIGQALEDKDYEEEDTIKSMINKI